MTTRHRYFSMFTGIGGFELAIERAALRLGLSQPECVGYSEIDKHAIATYERHYPEHTNYGDATTIDADDLPDFTILTAGFPCQAFSMAGKRLGFDETRGTLFFDVARVIRAKRPRKFILENVKGLVNHDGGRTFRTIVKTLVELGYCVEWKVLNSKDFGVPQSRERIYIVGHFGGIPEQSVFTRCGSGSPYSTVGLTTKTAVARTFTAGGHSGGNHSGMTIIRSLEGDRRLSIVEAERLQGFPDNWTVGSDAQRYKQCGNAVTVDVVETVVKELWK